MNPAEADPLLLITTLSSVELQQDNLGWGSYTVGLGRGQTGLSLAFDNGLVVPFQFGP